MSATNLAKEVLEIKKPRKQYQKRSLITKLAEVFRQIEMVEKKGTTPGYDYLRACDIYRVTRGLLMERNVIIFPNILSEHWDEMEVTKDGEIARTPRCTVQAEFRLEDGDSGEMKLCRSIGAAVGDHTALAAAITGAEKSMLKGLGMIVDEEADPEYDAAAAAPKVFIGKILDMRKTCLTIQQATGEPIKVKVEDEPTRNRLFANRKEDVRAECLLQVNKYGKQWWQVRDILIGRFQVAAANQPDLGAILDASAEQAALVNTIKSLAGQHQVPMQEVLRHVAEKYAVDAFQKLTPTELTEIIDWVFLTGKKPPQPVVSILDGEPDEITGD